MKKAAISVIHTWLVVMAMTGVLSGCANAERASAGQDDLDRIVRNYPALQAQQAERGTVKRIVDGDTFVLDQGEKVRLVGVNTPETHGKAEYYGAEAAAYTAKELLGRQVWLFPDVSGRDRYGRLLRYVFRAGEDVMFNERLIREGYAQVMTIPPNVACADLFLKQERDARSRKAGLWGAEAGNDENEIRRPEASPEAENSPSPCPNAVKGNINSKGNKIYHVPGSKSYDSTKPERWFCTEQEARDAGFRKAAN